MTSFNPNKPKFDDSVSSENTNSLSPVTTAKDNVSSPKAPVGHMGISHSVAPRLSPKLKEADGNDLTPVATRLMSTTPEQTLQNRRARPIPLKSIPIRLLPGQSTSPQTDPPINNKASSTNDCAAKVLNPNSEILNPDLKGKKEIPTNERQMNRKDAASRRRGGFDTQQLNDQVKDFNKQIEMIDSHMSNLSSLQEKFPTSQEIPDKINELKKQKEQLILERENTSKGFFVQLKDTTNSVGTRNLTQKGANDNPNSHEDKKWPTGAPNSLNSRTTPFLSRQRADSPPTDSAAKNVAVRSDSRSQPIIRSNSNAAPKVHVGQNINDNHSIKPMPTKGKSGSSGAKQMTPEEAILSNMNGTLKTIEIMYEAVKTNNLKLKSESNETITEKAPDNTTSQQVALKEEISRTLNKMIDSIAANKGSSHSNNSMELTPELNLLYEFVMTNEDFFEKHTDETGPNLKELADKLIIGFLNTENPSREFFAKAVEILETAILKQMEMDALSNVEKTDVPTDSPVGMLTNMLFKPPADKTMQNNFLASYRNLKNELLLCNENNQAVVVPKQPTKIIDENGKEVTGDRNGSLFIFLKSTYEKPGTSLYEKQQILNMAEQWVKDPFINSYHVTEMRSQIQGLIDLAKKDPSPTLRSTGEKLEKALAEATNVAKPQSKYIEGKKDLNVLVSSIRNGKLKPGKKDYQEAVQSFAASLSAQSTRDFKGITSEELNNLMWTKKDKETQAPNVISSSNSFNKMSDFLSGSILGDSIELNKDNPLKDKTQKEKQKEVARMIEFCVNVQSELLSPANGNVDFNSFMIISGTLSRSEINRIKPAFDMLPKDVIAELEAHKKLVNPDGASKNLREKMNMLNQDKVPFIPFTGMILTDITFATEGNPTIKEGKVNESFVTPLGTIIDNTKNWQAKAKEVSNDSEKSYNLRDLNSTYVENNVFNESKADGTSLMIFPRQKK